MKTFTIGKVADQADTSIETIRFYEREGLINAPPRRASGYREYLPETIDQLRFIKRAKELGFSLKEIRELLSLRTDPAADCSAVRAQASAKREIVKRKIEQLRRIDDALSALVAACPGRGALEGCTILNALSDSSDGAAPEALISDAGQSTRNPKTRRAASNRREKDMKSITLNIEGMNCDGCAATLKGLLQRQDGVKSASVTYEDGEARILFDPAIVGLDQLIATVERPGFRVTNRTE